VTGELPAQPLEKQQPAQKADKTTKDKTNQYYMRTAKTPGVKKKTATTLPVKKSTTKTLPGTLPGKPSQSRRKRRIANPPVLPLNISIYTINRNSVFVSIIPLRGLYYVTSATKKK